MRFTHRLRLAAPTAFWARPARRDEGRHVRIAVLATKRFLAEQGEAATERLLDLSVYYMDMADRLMRRA